MDIGESASGLVEGKLRREVGDRVGSGDVGCCCCCAGAVEGEGNV
jgi:hypothetical protein